MIMSFLTMTEVEAISFRNATEDRQNRLEPRIAESGPFKDLYVLPQRVTLDPAFEEFVEAFSLLKLVDIDIQIAWPIVEADDA